nr:transmembrane protein 210 isoform X1 [Manis javanica]
MKTCWTGLAGWLCQPPAWAHLFCVPSGGCGKAWAGPGAQKQWHRVKHAPDTRIAGWWGTSGPRKSAWTCTQCMWSPTLWILTWRSPRRCPRRVMASGPSPWFSDPRGAVPPSHLSRLWQLGVSGSALSSLPPPRAQVAGPWGRGTVYAPGSSLSSMRVPTPGTHCPPSRAGATLLYFRFLLHGLSLAPPCIFLLLCPLKLAGLLGLCPAPPPLNTRTGPAALATPEGTASGRRTRARAPAPPTLSP